MPFFFLKNTQNFKLLFFFNCLFFLIKGLEKSSLKKRRRPNLSVWDDGWVGLFEITDICRCRIVKEKTLLIILVDIMMCGHSHMCTGLAFPAFLLPCLSRHNFLGAAMQSTSSRAASPLIYGQEVKYRVPNNNWRMWMPTFVKGNPHVKVSTTTNREGMGSSLFTL